MEGVSTTLIGLSNEKDEFTDAMDGDGLCLHSCRHGCYQPETRRGCDNGSEEIMLSTSGRGHAERRHICQRKN